MQESHWVWSQTNGPVPRGSFICHSCDNTRCVNPAHLFLGTARDNTADMIAKGRGSEQQKIGCPHGHGPYDQAESNGHRRCSVCRRAHDAAKYLRRKARS